MSPNQLKIQNEIDIKVAHELPGLRTHSMPPCDPKHPDSGLVSTPQALSALECGEGKVWKQSQSWQKRLLFHIFQRCETWGALNSPVLGMTESDFYKQQNNNFPSASNSMCSTRARNLFKLQRQESICFLSIRTNFLSSNLWFLHDILEVCSFSINCVGGFRWGEF